MTAVLVHGNPETPAVWDPLVARLGRSDVATPALPGFGVPAPDGFGATKEEYVGWLVALLEEVGEPVDLVGHDWGGGIVLRVACIRPDLLRSWASDIAGALDPGYVWHDMAQVWQTPGAGEEYVAGISATPVDDRAALYESIGITGPAARAFAAAWDDEMGRCMLALYRSATQPALAAWGADAEAAAARPGLVIAADGDPYVGGVGSAVSMASRLRARVEVLEGRGHWWMLEDPAGGAKVLSDFWSSV